MAEGCKAFEADNPFVMLTRVLRRALILPLLLYYGGRRQLPLGPAQIRERLSALWEVALICFSIFSPTFSSLILSHRDALPITRSDCEPGKAAPECWAGRREAERREIKTRIMC